MQTDDFIDLEEYNSIDDIILKERLSQLKESFKDRTGVDLEYVVRVPGRINLIGDHIDYHGFAVLPMAIENCIWLGCSFEGKDQDVKAKLRVYNQEPELYPDFVSNHSLTHGCQLDKSHKWYHYILCGYHGILANKLLGVEPGEALQHSKTIVNSGDDASVPCLAKLTNFTILIQSDLPPASGLSSSSALVCASTVASLLFLKASRIIDHEKISNKQIAEDCSKLERLVGTHGGGMDQAVIMTAHEGYAKYVEFKPQFSCVDVQLPSNVSWLVSHCGIDHPKAATASFNSRVLETKLGAALLFKILGGHCSDIKTITLSKVKHAFFGGEGIEHILAMVRKKIPDPWSLSDICGILELTEEKLFDQFDTTREFFEENLGAKFFIEKRCQHVFEEEERVEKFKFFCAADAPDLKALGDIMTKSHYSLKDKYECSHPALDRLVEISLQSGALGARLSGAGWGGCVVTMVESDKCDYVAEKLGEVSRFTFRTEPQSGCSIIKF